MRSVSHSDDLVPTPATYKYLISSSYEKLPSKKNFAKTVSSEDNVTVYSAASNNKPHWITQEDLNDIACDFDLSKQQSDLLASLLKQWNLVTADVRISSFRTQKDFASFLKKNRLCYCRIAYLK